MQLPYPVPHDFALILAPMAGVSEAPFRQICRRMGADVVLSEFLSSEAIRRRIRNTLEGAEFEECERPIGIQIYGADPAAMAEATALITEHYQPEFIDINFGCPVKKVVRRNGGSGCLREPQLVTDIIRACVGATHLPVTVKTRSGWNDEMRDPVGIALRMQDAGARAFTLHARTRTQMYSGKANWDEIARVVEALEIPVIGNGDVQTPEDVVRLRDHTRAAGVMVAPAPHLRSDEQILAYFAQAVEAIGADVPWALQDYPLTLTVLMSVPAIARIMSEHPSCVMLKAEDWPGLEKLSALRKLQADGTLRPFSILTANGGLFLDFEPERGSDGAMTGYAFPDMLVDLIDLHAKGKRDAAHDLFDAHLPLIRYEQQPAVGLSVRKYVLMKRGIIASDLQRRPGPSLSATARAEIDYLLQRLARHDRRAAI